MDNFIGELYDDFHFLIPDYKFKEYIEYVLTEKDKPEILSFRKLFNIDSALPDLIFDDLIEIKDDNIFNNIIDKYSGIYIKNKDIPLDPLTNLTLSNNEFNISELILKYILKKFCNFSKNIYIVNQNRLEKIISHLPKSNDYFTLIIYTLNFKRYRNHEVLSVYIKNNISEKTCIDI